MAWTDVCKLEAIAQIEKRREVVGGVRAALREIADESEIPYGTLRDWYYPDKSVPKTRNTYQQSEYPTCAVSDLQTLIEKGIRVGTVYADPPWPYDNQATRSATNNHYQTMSLPEIMGLPIPELTCENAHLHLWTTNAFLFDAKHIIESWGFKYKSCFVWVKPQMGIGNYWRVSHEFLLLGVKGKAPFRDKSLKSWSEIDRTEHSEKPERIRDMIEKASPGAYLELFGRRLAKNWIVWGNEIKKDLFYDSLNDANI